MPVPKGSIDLWLVDLDRWAEAGLDPASLTAGDRAAGERLRDDVVAQRLLARRSAIRTVLADIVGLDVSDLAIGRACSICGGTDHGRPAVVGASVEFSLSASGRVAVLAVSDRPVGVDIEEVRGQIAPLATALSQPEQLGIARLDCDQQAVGLLRLWTAKEAVLKAWGRNLADDPAGVDVSGLLTTDRVTVVDEGRPWTVRVATVGIPQNGQAVLAVADEDGVGLVRRSVDDPPPPAAS
ncbi:MAG: 4'-phosphopantetheinyl transferase family protein [Acidimicrobiales bacterium]